MRIWRLITHHERGEEALEQYRSRGVIALGWGDIGDLRSVAPGSRKEIYDLIREAYPMVGNAKHGAASLLAMYNELSIDDLVILSTQGVRRAVMRVTGPYVWTEPDAILGEYQHRRTAELASDVDPNEAWREGGAEVASGFNIRMPLIPLRRDPMRWR